MTKGKAVEREKLSPTELDDYFSTNPMFVDRISTECRCWPLTEEERKLPPRRLTEYDKFFMPIFRRFKNPEVRVKSFKEFSSRIVKVDCNSEPGKCCLRGHDNDSTDDKLYTILMNL
jgi:hypothetical protein